MSVTAAARRFGFVGLGDQGAPMARRAIDAGLPVTLYARRPATLAPFAPTTAEVAPSLSALAAACDVVAVCVTDDRATEEVVLGNGDEEGLAAGLGTGNVVVVHATVHPDTCRRLAARLAAAGIDLLDAPVSGGRVAAAAGRLTVMVGGDQKALDACRPLFDTYASAVSHVGPVGAGQTVKLLNNLAFAAQLAVAHDVVELGERLGVDAEKLLEVLAQGSGASAALGIYGRLGSLAALGPGIDLLAKDLDLMADVASGVVATPDHVMAAGRRAVELARADAAPPTN